MPVVDARKLTVVSRRIAAIASLALGCAQPISKGYEIHTADLTCDEANRQAYAAVVDMGMEVTSFRPARTGSPGVISARRSDSRGNLGGDVEIRCDAGAVSIVSNQSGGFLGDKEFERGVFLSIAGRTGLEVVRDGRYATGEMKRREAPSDAGAAAGTDAMGAPASAAPSATKPQTSKLSTTNALAVTMEPLRGFASILDFEADLGTGGVLPVKVVITNGTSRRYDFDAAAIVLRPTGERTQVQPLTPTAALARIRNTAAGGAELGDVEAAGRMLKEKALVGGRLAPGTVRTGFVYFPLADYDRARLLMTDVATGEAEGFAVDF